MCKCKCVGAAFDTPLFLRMYFTTQAHELTTAIYRISGLISGVDFLARMSKSSQCGAPDHAESNNPSVIALLDDVLQSLWSDLFHVLARVLILVVFLH
jgi:hypothetical protein